MNYEMHMHHIQRHEHFEMCDRSGRREIFFLYVVLYSVAYVTKGVGDIGIYPPPKWSKFTKQGHFNNFPNYPNRNSIEKNYPHEKNPG